MKVTRIEFYIVVIITLFSVWFFSRDPLCMAEVGCLEQDLSEISKEIEYMKLTLELNSMMLSTQRKVNDRTEDVLGQLIGLQDDVNKLRYINRERQVLVIEKKEKVKKNKKRRKK